MRKFLLRLLNAVPREELPFYYYEREIAAYPHLEKRFYKLIDSTLKGIQKIHPEYRNFTMDKYVLASFAKRFLGNWINIVTHTHRSNDSEKA